MLLTTTRVFKMTIDRAGVHVKNTAGGGPGQGTQTGRTHTVSTDGLTTNPTHRRTGTGLDRVTTPVPTRRGRLHGQVTSTPTFKNTWGSRDTQTRERTSLGFACVSAARTSVNRCLNSHYIHTDTQDEAKAARRLAAGEASVS